MRASKAIGALLTAGALGLYPARGLSPDDIVVSPAVDEFALALYRHLASAEGNLALCPGDVAATLAMVYGGARGPSAAE